MLQEIFTSQRQFINYFFDHVQLQEAEQLLCQLLSCKGMLVFTGVGKSGIVAEKLAKTMISTGTRSLYLPPTQALHGDIGILGPEDLLIILSKTGASEEVLQLARCVQKRKIPTMGWVSSKDSPLESIVDTIFCLPLEREICPFDMVPTTSTALQMIFGDILAIGLMKAKKFDLQQYALNHPGGNIGKLICTRVEDLMVTDQEIPTCKGDEILRTALYELSRKRCGCLLIVDSENHVEGIFTDGDLRRCLEKEGANALNCKMGEICTKEYLYAHPELLASEALGMMERKKKIMMLPVLDEKKKLVGLIHMHHLLEQHIGQV